MLVRRSLQDDKAIQHSQDVRGIGALRNPYHLDCAFDETRTCFLCRCYLALMRRALFLYANRVKDADPGYSLCIGFLSLLASTPAYFATTTL